MTGPATVNIFAPTPKTKPSERASRASEVIEFAKPVIGTRVPAPANFAILSKSPKAVRSEARKIKEMLTQGKAVLSEAPRYL